MCTCAASIHGDFLDDAVQHCHLVQPIIQAAWAIISVMGVVVTVAGLQRVWYYIRKQHQLKLQVSWHSDPVFRLLILLSFVGCGYAVLATLKLFDPDAAIGASVSATCVYCICFTLFPAFAFQLIWSWVQVACSSALGRQHEMEVLLRKLKLGFRGTSTIVLVSAWAPAAMLLPSAADGKVRTRFTLWLACSVLPAQPCMRQMMLFASHYAGFAVGNLFLTACINEFGAKIVQLLLPSASCRKTAAQARRSQVAMRFMLVRRASLVTGLGNALFFVVIVAVPWLRVRSSYTLPLIANSALGMCMVSTRMFKFLNA